MDIFKFTIHDEEFPTSSIAEWYEEVTDCVSLIKIADRQFKNFQKRYPDVHYKIERMTIHFSEDTAQIYVRQYRS